MFCSKCGTQVADGLRFCSQCGAPMPQQPETKSNIPQTEVPGQQAAYGQQPYSPQYGQQAYSNPYSQQPPQYQQPPYAQQPQQPFNPYAQQQNNFAQQQQQNMPNAVFSAFKALGSSPIMLTAVIAASVAALLSLISTFSGAGTVSTWYSMIEEIYGGIL